MEYKDRYTTEVLRDRYRKAIAYRHCEVRAMTTRRQTEIFADSGPTKRRTCRKRYIQRYRETERQQTRHNEWQIERKTERQLASQPTAIRPASQQDRQTDCQKERQADRQLDRQTARQRTNTVFIFTMFITRLGFKWGIGGDTWN